MEKFGLVAEKKKTKAFKEEYHAYRFMIKNLQPRK